MFKLGAKNLFLLCLLVKKKSAVYSADRCNFSEPDTDCSRNGNNLYKIWVEGAFNSKPFGHFRFSNHNFNWQILIKVWSSVIGLSCLIRTILEYKKVRQIWTLLLGVPKTFNSVFCFTQIRRTFPWFFFNFSIFFKVGEIFETFCCFLCRSVLQWFLLCFCHLSSKWQRKAWKICNCSLTFTKSCDAV